MKSEQLFTKILTIVPAPLMFKDIESMLVDKEKQRRKLKQLKDICEQFNIDVIGSKIRKDFFINPLLDLILACKCT